MFKEINYEEYISMNLDKIYSFDNNPYVKIIVFLEEKLVGFLVYSLIYDRIEIYYIYVDKNHRNRKIGTKLLNYLIKIGIDNDCENITLEVSIENEHAIKLYKKCGFVEVAKRERYYKGIDAILMMKKLGD